MFHAGSFLRFLGVAAALSALVPATSVLACPDRGRGEARWIAGSVILATETHRPDSRKAMIEESIGHEDRLTLRSRQAFVTLVLHHADDVEPLGLG